MTGGTLDLIGRIYEAAMTPRDWPTVLTGIADSLQARGGHFMAFDQDNRAVLGEIGKLPRECHEQYAVDYVQDDPRIARLAQWPNNSFFADNMVMTEDELAESPTHQDLFPRFDIYRTVGFKSSLSDGGYFAMVFAIRAGQTEFSDEQVRQMMQIYPHVQRAARIQIALNNTTPAAPGALDALDALDIGVILCGREAQIIHANRHAESMLRRADGLCSVGRTLTASLRTDADRLRTLVGRSCLGAAGGEMLINRDTGAPVPLIVSPSPRTLSGLGPGRPGAVVFFRDPDQRPTSPERSLQVLYGLTPGESRLAAALLNGQSIAAYAEQAAITKSTAQTVLKRVLQKTDTHRQGEMIALLLRRMMPLNLSTEP